MTSPRDALAARTLAEIDAGIAENNLQCDHDWDYSMRGGHEYEWRTCVYCSLAQEKVWVDVQQGDAK